VRGGLGVPAEPAGQATARARAYPARRSGTASGDARSAPAKPSASACPRPLL